MVLKLSKIDFNNFTNSSYVNEKYQEFYKRNGYIPTYFQPYNLKEIKDYSVTITTSTGIVTGIGAMYICTETK